MSQVFNADLVGKRESVVDELLLLNPHQTPLINLLGFGNPVTQVEFEWYEDEMFPYVGKLAQNLPDDGTNEDIDVDDVEPFRKDQVIKINEELMKVTDVDSTNNQIDVEREYAGTSQGSHSNEDTIEVMFVEGEEGSDVRKARYKARKRVSNYTQIFDEAIKISGTAAVVGQYGIEDLYEHEKQKKQLELALQLEKALINGVKYESNQVRMMKGIREFIDSNVDDASSSDISDEKLNDAMQDIYEAGGFATGGNYVIMVPAKQKRKISGFDKADIRLERTENTRGQVVDMYVSDFGQAEIVLNNNLKSDEAIIADTNRMAIRPLNEREFFHEYMGKKGDYFEGMLVGEYTLQFEQEKAHARIKNLG